MSGNNDQRTHTRALFEMLRDNHSRNSDARSRDERIERVKAQAAASGAEGAITMTVELSPDIDITHDGRARPRGQFPSCVVCPDCGRCELCGTLARPFVRRNRYSGASAPVQRHSMGVSCGRCARERNTGFRAAGAMHIIEGTA